MVGEDVIGYVPSGEYGYSVGKFLAYAYVSVEHAGNGTKLRVRYTGNFYEGTVVDMVQLDPKNERMKG